MRPTRIELDDIFWADLGERTFAGRPKRDKSVAAELGFPADGPNDESARQEFLDRCPEAFEKLKEGVPARANRGNRPNRCFGIRRRPADFDGGKDRVGPRRRQRPPDPARPDNTSIVVATPQRCFQLSKTPTDARFQTTHLAAGSSAAHGYAPTHYDILVRAPELDAPFQLPWIVDLLERIRSPGFAITRAVASWEGPIRLVRVYYESAVLFGDRPHLEAGWWSFRPDDCWAIDAYEGASSRMNLTHAPRASPRVRTSLSTGERSITAAARTECPCSNRLSESGAGPGSPRGWAREECRSPTSASDLHRTRRSTWPRSTRSRPRRNRRVRGRAHAHQEDIFTRLTRWLVWAIWFCSAGVVISGVLPWVWQSGAGIARLLKPTRK